MLGPLEFGEENKNGPSGILVKETDADLCPKCGHANFPDFVLDRIDEDEKCGEETFSEYWGTDSEDGDGDNILDLPEDCGDSYREKEDEC